MKTLAFILLPLLLLGTHGAAATPDQLFPENAAIYVEFSDIARMSERWKSSPAVKNWKSDELRDIREWLLEDGPMAEIFSDASDDPELKAMKASLKLYEGSFSIGVLESQAWLESIKQEMDDGDAALLEDFDLNAPLEELENLGAEEDQGPQPMPAFMKHMVFLAEIGNNLDKIRQSNLDQVKEMTAREKEAGLKSSFKADQMDGVEVLIHEKKFEDATETHYTAYLDGWEVSTASEKALRMMFDHIRSGSANNPLSGNRAYARAKSQAENHDMLAHVNMSIIGQYIHEQLADDDEPNPLLGISLAQIANALELDAVAPITATIQLKPEGIAFRSNLGFTRETRLSKVMLPYVQEKFARPGFIPKDVVSVNSARVGLAPWWDAVIGLVGALSPQLGQVINAMLLQSHENFGFDIKNDLINALGDEMVYAQKMSLDAPAAMDGQSTLVGLKVKNRQSIERVIRKLSAQMAPDGGEVMEMEEFLGHEIHSMQPGLPPGDGESPTIAYTFIDDYLVVGVGVADMVKSAIRASRNPDQSIWETADMKRALSMVPGDTPWFEFGRVDQVFRIMGGLMSADLVGGVEPGADPDADAGDEALPDMTPLSKLIGQAVNTSYIEEQRVFTQGFLLYPTSE